MGLLIELFAAAIEADGAIGDVAISQPVKSHKHLSGQHDQSTHGTGGGPTVEEQKPSDRAARALASHNPSTAEKQRASDRFEAEVAKNIGAERTGDNLPMDNILDDVNGVEIKALHDAKEGRVNMRPDSRQRKEQWAKEAKGRTLHTVLIDNRDTFQDGAHADKYSGHKMYYAKGVAAFRLGQMTKVKSYGDLKKLVRGDKVTIEAYGLRTLHPVDEKYDPSQPRDEQGQWSEGGAAPMADFEAMMADVNALSAGISSTLENRVSEIRSDLGLKPDTNAATSERARQVYGMANATLSRAAENAGLKEVHVVDDATMAQVMREEGVRGGVSVSGFHVGDKLYVHDVDNDTQLTNVLHHELAHALDSYDYGTGKHSVSESDEWLAATGWHKTKSGRYSMYKDDDNIPITDYAKKAPWEDFAESVKAYMDADVHNRAAFKEFSPKRHEFVKQYLEKRDVRA